MLAEQFKSLSLLDLDFSLEATGFDMSEIDLRIQGLEDDEVLEPELPAPPSGSAITQLGDLWELGPHRVLCGKPPANSKFERGQSGNPRGRPKGAKNLGTVLQNALSERVTVTVNGKRVKMSKLEAAITQSVNKAAGGDNRAMAQLLTQVQALELQKSLSSTDAATLGADDMKVLDSLITRLGRKETGDGD